MIQNDSERGEIIQNDSERGEMTQNDSERGEMTKNASASPSLPRGALSFNLGFFTPQLEQLQAQLILKHFFLSQTQKIYKISCPRDLRSAPFRSLDTIVQ